MTAQFIPVKPFELNLPGPRGAVQRPGPVCRAGDSLLLVDDDACTRGRLQRVLTGKGFVVTGVASISAALATAAKIRFAYAVVEMRLDDGTGLTLVSKLRHQHASIRIVIVTGFDSFATVIQALRAGAIDYLPKPVQETELTDALLGCSPSFPPIPDTPLGIERIRWEYIQRVFAQCGRNVSKTAQRLGMHRRTLQRILGKRAPSPRGTRLY